MNYELGKSLLGSIKVGRNARLSPRVIGCGCCAQNQESEEISKRGGWDLAK